MRVAQHFLQLHRVQVRWDLVLNALPALLIQPAVIAIFDCNFRAVGEGGGFAAFFYLIEKGQDFGFVLNSFELSVVFDLFELCQPGD